MTKFNSTNKPHIFMVVFESGEVVTHLADLTWRKKDRFSKNVRGLPFVYCLRDV